MRAGDELITSLLRDLPAAFDRERFREVYRRAWAKIVRGEAAVREPEYRLRHGHRVARLGWQLLQAPEIAGHRPPAEAEIVWLGGLLHDVAKTGLGEDPPGVDHAAAAAAFVRSRLGDVWDGGQVERVAEVVHLHNKRQRPASLEARVVRDADLLDHFGAVEVWLASYVAAARRESLEACLAYLTGVQNRAWREYAMGHAFFATTRRLLAERLATADRLILRLQREAAGELYPDPL